VNAVVVGNEGDALPLTACDEPDLHYQFGIDMFIAGVQAVARRADARQHPVSPAQGGGEPRR
jgi:hypothetical protein